MGSPICKPLSAALATVLAASPLAVLANSDIFVCQDADGRKTYQNTGTGKGCTRLDIQPAPGSVVCPDDVTDRKPHPETLYRNCRDLECSPHEAIYVGDHLRDIEAGRRAGMYTIAAAYGYIEPDDDPGSWGADARADRSTQLTGLIFSHE